MPELDRVGAEHDEARGLGRGEVGDVNADRRRRAREDGETAGVRRGREHEHAARRFRELLRTPRERRGDARRDRDRPFAGHASSRPASGASSSSASGLPPVASYRRSAASPTSAAASARSRPATRRTRRSEPSRSDGSPSRTVSTTAIGSATSRRAANSSASALDPSSQCASSTSSASGVSSAHADSRLSVAAPIAKRSCAAPGPSASAPVERRRLRRRDPLEHAERRTQQLRQPGERHVRLRLDPAGAQHAHARRVSPPRSRAAPSCRSPARRRARGRRCGRRAHPRADGRGRAAPRAADQHPPILDD